MQGDLVLSYTIAKVISAMTSRTKADQAWVGVAYIMIGMCGVQIEAITFPCSSGFPLSALSDVAKLTLPTCSFLTLPC